MKARLAASAALALALVVGGTGCSMLTYQATTEKYDASDGVSANVGPLKVRNMLLVMDEGGADANLVFTVSNSSDDDLELEIGLVGGEPQTVEVAAHGQLVLGVDGAEDGEAAGVEVGEPILLEDVGTEPGELVALFLTTEGAEGLEVQTPVLDGRLPEYRHLRP